MSAQDELARLYAADLDYHQFVALLPRRCEPFQAWVRWDCCPRHRKAKAMGERLEERARPFVRADDGCSPLSNHWWQQRGFAGLDRVP